LASLRAASDESYREIVADIEKKHLDAVKVDCRKRAKQFIKSHQTNHQSPGDLWTVCFLLENYQ
jgi:hypothetical protein